MLQYAAYRHTICQEGDNAHIGAAMRTGEWRRLVNACQEHGPQVTGGRAQKTLDDIFCGFLLLPWLLLYTVRGIPGQRRDRGTQRGIRRQHPMVAVTMGEPRTFVRWPKEARRTTGQEVRAGV